MKKQKGIALVEILLTVFTVWMLAIAVASMLAQDECLAKGFPKGQVTYTFTAYCTGIQGDVENKVEKLK